MNEINQKSQNLCLLSCLQNMLHMDGGFDGNKFGVKTHKEKVS